jgi:outer membrane lipoprotein-sorting protein
MKRLTTIAYLFCSIIIVSFFNSSCRGSKKIQTAITKKDTTEVVVINPRIGHDDSMQFIQMTLDTIIRQKILFTTFNAKVDVDYTGGDGKKYDVNATVRMYKDSLIWVSVNAILGIEAMRLLITKDSVKLLNKLDKIYTARSVSYLQEVIALPLDLSTFQDLIIGNPVYLDSNVVSYTRSGEELSLLSVGSVFRHFITLHANDKVVQHSKMDDVDVLRNRTCDLVYEKYEDKKGVRFSTRRQITVSEKSKLDVKLDFKNYGFNETLSFPFSVPKNYDRN